MPDIELNELLKIYPFAKVKGLFGRKRQQEILDRQRAMPFTTNEGVIAVQHLSARIRQGEFVVLLGPSGCGKTTLLRMIAGLEEPTLGEVYFDGKLMNQVPPEEHEAAMVFQNYSLYPHLSVFDNIAFPLRNLHMPRAELEQAVGDMAALLDMSDCLDRLPGELSGGQLQRVAIARALVRRPKLLLMDEPFSNLDAPLRAALRQELKRLNTALGTTFVYVTHDQNDALSLGTRILVMRDGMLVQDGTPAEIYRRPADTFVAQAVGAPPMNLFAGLPVCRGESGPAVSLLGRRYPLPASLGEEVSAVTLGIRPVHVRLDPAGVSAQVEYVEPLGAETLLHLKAGEQELTALLESTASADLYRGQTVQIDLPADKLHLFGPDGKRIE